jgi:hypothetical protein
MHEITVVKRRTRVWPIVLTLFLLAIVVLAIMWMTGYLTVGQSGITLDALLIPIGSPSAYVARVRDVRLPRT